MPFRSHFTYLTLGSLIAAAPLSSALAAPAEASVSVGSDGASADASAEGSSGKDEPWIRRHRPRGLHGELGVFGGVMLPSRGIQLYEDGLSFRRYNRVAPDIGLRAGFYPLSFLGVELEGAIMPARTDFDERALMYGVRGSAILQLPIASIVPFAAAGGGLLGVSSDATAMGNDVDGSFHIGAGVKIFFHRNVGLRLDVRTNLSQKFDTSERADSEEILLGLAIRLGRKPKEKPAEPKDSDGDGFLDPDDACPREPGVEPDGCPVRDTDGDGFDDPVDACPEEPGIAPDGCPEKDQDGDGVLDDDDECPTEAGDPPSGCPVKDTDGDGLLDDVDQCVEEPETKNGYQDKDGCPDELPKEVEKFTGTIEGITFETNRDVIRKSSQSTLDEAVEVLKKYPELRLRIAGHTDSRGKRDHNLDLSRRRADAVKDYLVDEGIDASRLETRGAGPDEPVADNESKAGRAKNRRIDFEVISGS